LRNQTAFNITTVYPSADDVTNKKRKAPQTPPPPRFKICGKKSPQPGTPLHALTSIPSAAAHSIKIITALQRIGRQNLYDADNALPLAENGAIIPLSVVKATLAKPTKL